MSERAVCPECGGNEWVLPINELDEVPCWNCYCCADTEARMSALEKVVEAAREIASVYAPDERYWAAGERIRSALVELDGGA